MMRKLLFKWVKSQKNMTIICMLVGILLVITGCGKGSKDEQTSPSASSSSVASTLSTTLSPVSTTSPTATPVRYKSKKGKCGKNARWKYNGKNHVLTVYGKGTITKSIIVSTRNFADSIVIEKIVVKEGITAIEVDNFVYYLENLGAKQREPIAQVQLPDSMRTVASGAFKYMDMKSVNIPKNLKSISGVHFWDVTNLESVSVSPENKYFTIEDGVLFSKDKKKLIYFPQNKNEETYKIPDSVRKIGSLAFAHNEFIKNVQISKRLNAIGGGAFAECLNLSSIDLAHSTKITKMSDFNGKKYGCIYNTYGWEDEEFYPDDLYGIGTFEGTAITSIIIPDAVKYVASDTFVIDFEHTSEESEKRLKMSLQHIYIGKNFVGDINTDGERYAYSGQKSWSLWMTPIASIKVSPKNKKYKMKNNILYSKDGKTLYQVPTSNTTEKFVIDRKTDTISAGAFAWVKNMTNLTICGNLSSIGKYAFMNPYLYYFEKETYSSKTIEKVIVKGNIKRVGYQAFAGMPMVTFVCSGYIDRVVEGGFRDCIKLKRFTCKEGIAYIEREGFTNCDNMTEISLNKRIRIIEDNAFNSCDLLKKLTLSSSLEKIKCYAFSLCSNLTKVTLSKKTKVHKDAFYTCNKLKKKNIIYK